QIFSQIHLLQPLIILICNPVITFPQLFCLQPGQLPHPGQKFFCFLEKHWNPFRSQSIGIHIHFLCRRNNNLHDQIPNFSNCSRSLSASSMVLCHPSLLRSTLHPSFVSSTRIPSASKSILCMSAV